MNDRKDNREAEAVDRAVRALRATPMPTDPPGEVLEQVLAAGSAGAEHLETKTLKQRIIKMHRIAKIVAAVLLVALAVGGYLFFTVGQGGASITWADVQKKVLNAQTMAFTATMEQEGVPALEVKAMVGDALGPAGDRSPATGAAGPFQPVDEGLRGGRR
ncbi:MAG: hypothetical protein ACYS1C_13125 [Planctomycetota bacterium]|jgi:hypothetical protein